MHNKLIRAFVLALLLLTVSARAEIDVSIGINLPVYPDLVPVPGYPVYYAPNLENNYFFYDGLYWVYADDNWYESDWYNGPWEPVDPIYVPLYLLRVPVQYYRRPPRYFHDWAANQPPHWDQHWGNDWARHRSGWNHWNHNAVPARAPLPTYQRQYSGDRYTSLDQQRNLVRKNYQYRPQHSPLPKKYTQQQSPPSHEQPHVNPHTNSHINNEPEHVHPAIPASPQNQNRDNRHNANEHVNEGRETRQHRPAAPHVNSPQPLPHPMPNPGPPQAPHHEEQPRQTPPHQVHPQPHLQQRPAPQSPPAQRPPRQTPPEEHPHETPQDPHAHRRQANSD